MDFNSLRFKYIWILKSQILLNYQQNMENLKKAYKDGIQEHLAIMSEDFKKIEIPYVRIHSECLTGDALGSLKCDCQNS